MIEFFNEIFINPFSIYPTAQCSLFSLPPLCSWFIATHAAMPYLTPILTFRSPFVDIYSLRQRLYQLNQLVSPPTTPETSKSIPSSYHDEVKREELLQFDEGAITGKHQQTSTAQAN